MILMLGLNMTSVVLGFVFVSPRALNLGFKGGPLALTIVNITQCLVQSHFIFIFCQRVSFVKRKKLISYIQVLCCFAKRWLKQPETWPQFSMASLRTAMNRANLVEILSISVPAGLVMWSEWCGIKPSQRL